MGKKLFFFVLFAAFFFLLILPPENILAQTAADHSAVLQKNLYSKDSRRLQVKKQAIENILKKYHSPLLGDVDSFLAVCIQFGLDCYLLPAVAGLESAFGKVVYPNSYNPFGWGGGYIIFDSFKQAIMSVGKNLKQNYVDKGAITIDQIAPIYATSKTWAPRVKYFISQFQNEEEKIALFFDIIQVN